MSGFDLNAALFSLLAVCMLAVATWLVSVVKRDVSIVDSLWSILIVTAAGAYVYSLQSAGPRAAWLIPLAGLWALRLAGYITWRNWGEPEDYRYQQIRARNEPNFTFKSVYLVFVLQAVLAWIVAAPLAAALAGAPAAGVTDWIGAAVAVFGLLFETVGDAQLASFKGNPANRGQVMDKGLWRYTRHPNYFGECCVWWGFFIIAAGAGAAWTVVSPLLMTMLLLKVSGVALLEKDIVERRPQYRDYILRTSAFFPRPPRAVSKEAS